MSGPLIYEIPSIPGVRLISPLLYTEIEEHMDAKAIRPDNLSDGFVRDLLIFETSIIAFRVDDEVVPNYKPYDVSRFAAYLFHQETPLIEIATAFLGALRHLSAQTDLPVSSDDLNFWEWLSLDEMPALKERAPNRMMRAIEKSITATAITREQIETACACGKQFRAPVYDGVFLDALRSHYSHDYRASILYAAIAVESASAIVLDEHFEEVIRPFYKSEWRVIVRPTGRGNIIRKDPVWELIRKREDATSMLHEGALYVLGKSLLVENEALFQLVKRVRMTRNKIVHEGEPPHANSDQYLSLDKYGSSEALNCVDAVFKWLGIDRDYHLHEHGTEQLSETPNDGV